jgi:hypothetical protein
MCDHSVLSGFLQLESLFDHALMRAAAVFPNGHHTKASALCHWRPLS